MTERALVKNPTQDSDTTSVLRDPFDTWRSDWLLKESLLSQTDGVSAQPGGRADHAEVVAHESQQHQDDQHNPVSSLHSTAHHRFTLRFIFGGCFRVLFSPENLFGWLS
jgi:hypothetical protein